MNTAKIHSKAEAQTQKTKNNCLARCFSHFVQHICI